MPLFSSLRRSVRPVAARPFAGRLALGVLALAVLASIAVPGSSPLAAWPQEQVMKDSGTVGDRTTTAPQAPEVADTCGGESFTEDDLPRRGQPWTEETVSFSLQFKDEVSPYRIMSVFVLPGDAIDLEVVQSETGAQFTACTDGGMIQREDKDEWTWTAPDRPGLYSLHVTESNTGDIVLLNAFVMTPYDGEPALNGYKIGEYQSEPLRGLPAYEMPEGLFEVGDEDLDTWLTPHFQLRQFLCKQASDEPKYLVVGERLLLKLEMLLQQVNERGIHADTFAVLSGYRTPHYNRAIGNTTKYSRHLYGDAADIYIDRDGNGSMDDLDGDGQVTVADAELLASVVDENYGEPWYRPYVGGLGLYGPKPHRGPFIHVDTRGFKARW